MQVFFATAFHLNFKSFWFQAVQLSLLSCSFQEWVISEQSLGLLAKVTSRTMALRSPLRLDTADCLKFLNFILVQSSLTLSADQPAEGEAGGGGQRQGDQRLLHRGLARQDRPGQYQLRVRQLTCHPEVELSQLEADERDVQPGA